jgi:hypothetical protein
MAAATDYLRNVDERANWSCINSTFNMFSFDISLLSMFFWLLCSSSKRKVVENQWYICIGVSAISFSAMRYTFLGRIQIRLLPRSCSNLVLRILLGFIPTSDEDRSRNISRSIKILSWLIWWNFDHRILFRTFQE